MPDGYTDFSVDFGGPPSSDRLMEDELLGGGQRSIGSEDRSGGDGDLIKSVRPARVEAESRPVA
jgi:hypothetical protein